MNVRACVCCVRAAPPCRCITQAGLTRSLLRSPVRPPKLHKLNLQGCWGVDLLTIVSETSGTALPPWCHWGGLGGGEAGSLLPPDEELAVLAATSGDMDVFAVL